MESGKQLQHLTEENKQWILKAIGYCLPVREIVSLAPETIGREISETCVKQWLAKPELWRKYREEYSKNLEDIPIASSKHRLHLLDTAVDKDIESNQGRSLATLVRESREEMRLVSGVDQGGQNVVIVQAEAQQQHAYRDLLSKYRTKAVEPAEPEEAKAPLPKESDTG